MPQQVFELPQDHSKDRTNVLLFFLSIKALLFYFNGKFMEQFAGKKVFIQIHNYQAHNEGRFSFDVKCFLESYLFIIMEYKDQALL